MLTSIEAAVGGLSRAVTEGQKCHTEPGESRQTRRRRMARTAKHQTKNALPGAQSHLTLQLLFASTRRKRSRSVGRPSDLRAAGLAGHRDRRL